MRMWDTRYFAQGYLGVLTVKQETVADRHDINDHILDLPTAHAIIAVGRTNIGRATFLRTGVSLSKPRQNDRTIKDRKNENLNKNKQTQNERPRKHNIRQTNNDACGPECRLVS